MFRRLPIWQACSTVRTAVTRPQCLASRLRLFHSSAVLRKTHYEALEVSETADAAAIKKAFYQKVRLYHPDVSPGNKENQKKFVEVSDAYQVLRDPDQRRQYDASLRGSPFGFGAGAGRPGPSSPYGYGGEWPFQQGGGGNFSNEDFMRMYRDMFGDVFEEVQRATRNSRHRPEYGPRSYATRGANGMHFEFHYYGGGPGGGRGFDFGPNMGGGPGMSLGQLLRAMSGSRKAFESLFGTKTYTATPGKLPEQFTLMLTGESPVIVDIDNDVAGSATVSRTRTAGDTVRLVCMDELVATARFLPAEAGSDANRIAVYEPSGDLMARITSAPLYPLLGSLVRQHSITDRSGSVVAYGRSFWLFFKEITEWSDKTGRRLGSATRSLFKRLVYSFRVEDDSVVNPAVFVLQELFHVQKPKTPS